MVPLDIAPVRRLSENLEGGDQHRHGKCDISGASKICIRSSKPVIRKRKGSKQSHCKLSLRSPLRICPPKIQNRAHERFVRLGFEVFGVGERWGGLTLEPPKIVYSILAGRQQVNGIRQPRKSDRVDVKQIGKRNPCEPLTPVRCHPRVEHVRQGNDVPKVRDSLRREPRDVLTPNEYRWLQLRAKWSLKPTQIVSSSSWFLTIHP